MENLTTILQQYTPISLEQMDHVQLLDRVDTKFVFNQEQLSEYLARLSDKYLILAIDGKILHPYETLYFDTPAYNLYFDHHNGHKNRYKLRFRKYVNSGISFFEVKSKTNARRTVKRRISVSNISESLSTPLSQFVCECTHDTCQDYVPALRVQFDRITLVNMLDSERLTIDINLRYGDGAGERSIDKIVIVEVKQQKHAISPFRQLMRENHQHKFYLSKYCLGITCLNESIKKNRFKRRLLALKKLGYDVS